ncbi:hypothetical protein DL93DRAFT_2080689 [Clavulina sp. PMI_390]|nr:hypothetical protein DL93DRAFT_2080689 [Clavulina sp. PMI_390]
MSEDDEFYFIHDLPYSIDSGVERLVSILEMTTDAAPPHYLRETDPVIRLATRNCLLGQEAELKRINVDFISMIPKGLAPIERARGYINRSLAPIHALPQELLFYIFMHATSVPGAYDRREPQMVLTLSHVCSHWRSAAYAMSALFTSADWNKWSTHLLREWCRLSKGRKLHVSLHSSTLKRIFAHINIYATNPDASKPNDLHDLVMKSTPSWGVLEIASAAERFSFPLKYGTEYLSHLFLYGVFTSLTSLRLGNSGFDASSGPACMDLSQFPSLESLEYAGPLLYFPRRGILAHLHNLSHVILQYPSANCLPVSQLFGPMVSLKYLQLKDMDDTWSDRGHSVNTEVLEITGSQASALRKCWKLWDFPNLQSLTLENIQTREFDFLMCLEDIATMAPELRHLTILDYDSAVDSWTLHLVECLNQPKPILLESLTIDWQRSLRKKDCSDHIIDNVVKYAQKHPLKRLFVPAAVAESVRLLLKAVDLGRSTEVIARAGNDRQRLERLS